jgi:hypothetical protein
MMEADYLLTLFGSTWQYFGDDSHKFGWINTEFRRLINLLPDPIWDRVYLKIKSNQMSYDPQRLLE